MRPGSALIRAIGDSGPGALDALVPPVVEALTETDAVELTTAPTLAPTVADPALAAGRSGAGRGDEPDSVASTGAAQTGTTRLGAETVADDAARAVPPPAPLEFDVGMAVANPSG